MNIEHISWRDACSEDNDWISTRKAIKQAKQKLPLIESVGFVLHEDKDAITLVHSFDKEDSLVTPAIKIPKKWIIKRKKL